MSDWSSRAEAYRNAPEQREGEDLDLIVEWAAGARTALDVATGGGHVARRLREAGLQVVSADPAPGMQPDVICRAEDLPFADGAFDLVVTRIAPHHFDDVAAAVAEMARVSGDLVVVEDTLYVSEQVEEAEKLRDPTHVRSYTEEEWRSFLEAAGLEVEEVESFEKRHSLEPGSRAPDTPAEDRPRVKELLADQIEGDEYVDTKLVLKARKASLDGDHRRQGHEARRPGPDRLRGLVPRAPQQALRHPGRRRRHAGQGRPGRRGHPRLRHRRRRGRRDRREHDDGLRPRPLRRRRDLRGGRRGHRHRRSASPRACRRTRCCASTRTSGRRA